MLHRRGIEQDLSLKVETRPLRFIQSKSAWLLVLLGRRMPEPAAAEAGKSLISL